MKFNLKRKPQNEMFAQAANEPVYKKAEAVGLGIGTSVMTGLAFADGIDTTATVTLIGQAAVAVAAIGVAVLAVKVGVRVYKWAAASL